MNKPTGYDETQAFTGQFEELAPGGYICRIRRAREEMSRAGRPMLRVFFDIDEGERKGFYQRTFDRQSGNYDNASWKGTYSQLTDGNSVAFFKGMITAIEESNPGYTFNWDEETLKGRLFGGVFGREEYIGSDGKARMITKCLSIRSVAAVRAGIEPPKDKMLPSSPAPQDGFTPTNEKMPWE